MAANGMMLSHRSEVSVADVEHPLLRRLLDYWHSKCAGRPMPARADLDPAEFRWALGHIVLIDVLPGEGSSPRFRYRLTGSTLTGRLRFDPGGQFMDNHPDVNVRRRLSSHCAEVVQRRHPLRLEEVRDEAGKLWRYEVLTMPLSSDGLAVDMLFGSMAPLTPA